MNILDVTPTITKKSKVYTFLKSHNSQMKSKRMENSPLPRDTKYHTWRLHWQNNQNLGGSI